VVYGWEYYYGGGIQASRPGKTMAGRPLRIIPMGKTKKTQTEFHEFLRAESHKFTPETYSLLKHNCNNFTSHCAKFLLDGTDIPSYITGLPEEALDTPLGRMFRPFIENMENEMKRSFNAGGGAGLVPWQERGLPTSHASLWLPEISDGSDGRPARPYVVNVIPIEGIASSNSTESKSAAAAAPAAGAAAPAAPAAAPAAPKANVTMPAAAVPDDVVTHGELKLRRLGGVRNPAQASVAPAGTKVRQVFVSLEGMYDRLVPLLKTTSSKPSVTTDEKRALSETQKARLTAFLASVQDPATKQSPPVDIELLEVFEHMTLKVSSLAWLANTRGSV